MEKSMPSRENGSKKLNQRLKKKSFKTTVFVKLSKDHIQLTQFFCQYSPIYAVKKFFNLFIGSIYAVVNS